MTILLSMRAGSRSSRKAGEFLYQFFRSRGIEPVIRYVRTGAEITSQARQAAESGEKTVVAGGGDGTVSAVAGALIGTEAALGVLPLGTLNHFARDLGIPLDLEAAAQVLMTGRVVDIDTGEVNGRLFLNNSSLGLYPALVFERERRRGRGWNRWLAMVWAALNIFRRFPALDIRLDAEGREIVRTTPFVFVGNNEYAVEGFNMGRRHSLDCGVLWVFVAPHKSSRWRLIRLTLRALAGRVRRDHDFHALSTANLAIEARRRLVRVALDGEVFTMAPPLRYCSRPRSLRVIVPAPHPV